MRLADFGLARGAWQEPAAGGGNDLTHLSTQGGDPPTRVFVGDRDLGVTPLRGVIVPSGTLPLILELPGGDRRRTSVLVRGGGEETRVHLNASELR